MLENGRRKGVGIFSSRFLVLNSFFFKCLSVSVFTDQYNLDIFKTRVNRLFLARHAYPRPHRHLTSGQITAKYLSTTA